MATPTVADTNGNVQPIHPIRVLIAGRDQRFLRVTCFLLERRGFDVETTPRLTGLHDIVESFRADVVALETDGSLTTAVRTAAALTALQPHVAVVLVTEDSTRHSSGDFRVVDKWGPIDRLADELELAYIGIPQQVPHEKRRTEAE